MRSRCRCPLFLFTLCFTLVLWHSAPPASAQNVRRRRTSFASTRRHANTAADKLGRADWPHITDGGPGTQVHITFDLRNADVVLMTGPSFSQRRLLAEARRIAVKIGRPQADYILFDGTKSVTTDIELNKYLVRPDAKHTASDLDLSALAAALNASSLPRPIVLFVRGDDADTARLTTLNPAQMRLLGDAAFFGLGEVPSGAHLHFAAAIPWYAPWVALGLAGFLLFTLISMALSPWRMAKQRAERQGKPAAVPTPDEVQQRYNKRKPVALVTSLLPLSFVLLSLFGNVHRLMTGVIYSLPFDPKPQTILFFPLTMVGVLGLSSLACTLVERRRARRMGEPLSVEAADLDAPPAWTQRWFAGVMVAMVIPMMVLPILLFNGTMTHLPWLRFVPFVMLGIMAVALVVGGRLTLRATRTNLPPGDIWHVMVDEVAARAGVRVRHVVRVQSPSVNAYASLFGTVGLTAGLLRKMEPGEVRVVIAHEVGHLRGGHVRRTFLLSLLVLAAFWALRWFGLHAAQRHLSDSAYIVLSGPIISVFVLPLVINLILGRGRRQREAEADRFAVQATGDPALVIATLTKLHTLNATPHQLKRSDELLSSHPSLAHRIEAIRSRDNDAPSIRREFP